MSTTLTVSEARAALPQLLDRVSAGEEVTITRHGRPAAVLVRPDTTLPAPASGRSPPRVDGHRGRGAGRRRERADLEGARVRLGHGEAPAFGVKDPVALEVARGAWRALAHLRRAALRRETQRLTAVRLLAPDRVGHRRGRQHAARPAAARRRERAGRRGLRQARVRQPRRQREGPPRAADDAGRARRRAPHARQDPHRLDERQHRRRLLALRRGARRRACGS